MQVFVWFTLSVITPMVLTLAFVLVRGSLKAENPAHFAIEVLKRIPALFRVLWEGARSLRR
ncbi:hypothetical protein [Streptomyces aquilus]|uniref:hypothetical protein n=1 Tax=Streptomyces aquilus TaxID=2548456 RepID=UPI0014170A55|nr:hypothetical protein [Streptomyces aquilus]